MIDHASKHLDPALTPQILLKSANLIKEIVWVSKPSTETRRGDVTHAGDASRRFISGVQNKRRCFGTLLRNSAATVGRIRWTDSCRVLKTFGQFGRNG